MQGDSVRSTGARGRSGTNIWIEMDGGEVGEKVEAVVWFCFVDARRFPVCPLHFFAADGGVPPLAHCPLPIARRPSPVARRTSPRQLPGFPGPHCHQC